MNRRDRKLAARARQIEAVDEARADARATFMADHGKGARAYDGHTPAMIDGRPTFRGQGGGGCGRSRAGRVERRGGHLTFVPSRDRDVSYALTKPSETPEFQPPKGD